VAIFSSGNQSQDTSAGDAVQESGEVGADREKNKDAIEEEEEGVDDSTYETEEEPTTGTESEYDGDFDKNQHKRSVSSVIQKTFEPSLVLGDTCSLVLAVSSQPRWPRFSFELEENGFIIIDPEHSQAILRNLSLIKST